MMRAAFWNVVRLIAVIVLVPAIAGAVSAILTHGCM